MAVTLKQSHALRQMAGLLSSFLPGSGDWRWKGHISFASVARDLGLGDLWPGGSKQAAIAALLERTLDRRPDRFEPLLLAIVRHGITYRQKKGEPIRRDEIETLNGLLLEVGFKFPDLWDSTFLDSLDGDPTARARAMARSVADVTATTDSPAHRAALWHLRTRFYALASNPDRQAAGRALQDLLNELFQLFGLEPRQPFRVSGEEIDGSFLLDYETYLVEAKWTKEPVGEADLLVFRGKVEGKSAFTRGVFISLSGFSVPAPDALTRGKQPNFFLIDGYDLSMVLEGQADLPLLLRQKVRALTEEGKVFVSAKELLPTTSRTAGKGVLHG